MPALPTLASVELIGERLRLIFVEGTPNRNYCVREIAAKTIFVMLCVGAVHGTNRWLRPDQVTRMTDSQALQGDDADRIGWVEDSLRPNAGSLEGRWYAANTREPIRDETLREGLIPAGAVREREGLPTTSPKPRYALNPTFAVLLDPALQDAHLGSAIESWRNMNLSPVARARVAIVRRGAVAAKERILVSFPNGETRHLEPGPSSVVAKAVIEEFAPRFLKAPGVIWLSESRHRVVARDDELAQAIGLTIRADRYLPDIILVDLDPPLVVFIEVVATAGPVNESRKTALLAIATGAGFTADHVAFVSAYQDRDQPAFKRTVSSLAWGSFAWFVSEPDRIVLLHEGGNESRSRLSKLLRGS